jgi:3',5'-cyclic AMP phosphodiesterase CpdA
MRVYLGLALICLTLSGLLSGAHIAWTLAHSDTPPAVLPPAGEALQGRAPYRFAVMGDSRGNNSVFELVMAGAQKDGAAFILHTGDLVRDCSRSQFEWLLEELQEMDVKVPFCTVPGNHDLTKTGANRRLFYERAFGPRQYWFSYANALFVAFDDAAGHCTPEDLQWLDGTLARLRPQYDECFVFTHIPSRDPRPNAEHALPEDEANALIAVLKKHSITAIFAGHIHTYLEDKVDGIPVYITGGAGADRDQPMGPFHYLLCTVNEKGALEVRKVDVPDVANTDYAEYVYWVKYPVEQSLAASLVFLVAGIALAWRSYRLAGQLPGAIAPEQKAS